VVPRGAARLVAKAGPHPVVELGRGETVSIGEVEVTAVPAEHGGRRDRWGNEIEPVGYVIRNEERSVYFAGDTECTAEMKALKNIDVAFIPMNLPYTMTAEEAADAVKAFAPKIVYPYHYKGQDTNVFAAALKGTGIDVRLRDWYAK